MKANFCCSLSPVKSEEIHKKLCFDNLLEFDFNYLNECNEICNNIDTEKVEFLKSAINFTESETDMLFNNKNLKFSEMILPLGLPVISYFKYGKENFYHLMCFLNHVLVFSYGKHLKNKSTKLVYNDYLNYVSSLYYEPVYQAFRSSKDVKNYFKTTSELKNINIRDITLIRLYNLIDEFFEVYGTDYDEIDNFNRFEINLIQQKLYIYLFSSSKHKTTNAYKLIEEEIKSSPELYKHEITSLAFSFNEAYCKKNNIHTELSERKFLAESFNDYQVKFNELSRKTAVELSIRNKKIDELTEENEKLKKEIELLIDKVNKLTDKRDNKLKNKNVLVFGDPTKKNHYKDIIENDFKAKYHFLNSFGNTKSQTSQDLLKNVDLVIIITSYISHSLCERIYKMCDKTKVLYVNSSGSKTFKDTITKYINGEI